MKQATAKVQVGGLHRHCECTKNTAFRLVHIGEDYIGIEVDGEYMEVGGFEQHIIWELLRREGSKR